MTTIHWLNDGKNEGGVAERQFVIKGSKGPVPGIIWAPDPVESPVPLVLFGHGGSGHKRNDRSLMLGRRLAGVSRYAVVAIDGPTHGDRAHPQSVSEGVDPMEVLADIGVDTALDGMVEDWCATLDHVTECDFINPDQVAYVGFSMGTRFGLPFVAAAGGRLRCAVLGKTPLNLRINPAWQTVQGIGSRWMRQKSLFQCCFICNGTMSCSPENHNAVCLT